MPPRAGKTDGVARKLRDLSSQTHGVANALDPLPERRFVPCPSGYIFLCSPIHLRPLMDSYTNTSCPSLARSGYPQSRLFDRSTLHHVSQRLFMRLLHQLLSNTVYLLPKSESVLRHNWSV